MSNLILAQGATHAKPHQLKKMLEQVNKPLYGEDSLHKIYDRVSSMVDDPSLLSTIQCYANTNYIMEPKFDGFSYLNSQGRFYSRSLSTAKGEEGTPVDKTDRVLHLVDTMTSLYEQCGLDVHGEIYIPGGTSDDVTSIMGCTPEKAKKRIYDNWDKRPRYVIYDIRAIYDKSVIDHPYYIRRMLLEYVMKKYWSLLNNSDVHMTNILPGDPREAFAQIVSVGGEGLVIKNTSAKYCPDKKPANNWIKCKKKMTHDVVIMGINDNGTGKNADLFGSLRIGHIIEGNLKECGNCNSGISDELRREIAENISHYINKVIEIEAMSESNNQSFRHARFLRFRDDKSAYECLAEDVRPSLDIL